MKHLPLVFAFPLLLLTACQEKGTSRKSSSTSPLQCSNQNDYFYKAGCPGYCQMYPTNPTCYGGGTTGGTTGTTTGGTTGGVTNPFPQVPSNPVNSNWGVKYPGGVPAGSCSATFNPSGISFTPYETRKATMTIVGKSFYSPASAVAANYLNTSSLLRSVSGARSLFSTDSTLKVRFKVIQQPESSNASPYCYGRNSGPSIPGYTKLQFNVQLVGTRSDGTIETEPLGTYTIGVNSCTPAIDLSSYASTYPGGIYLVVQSVKSNQGPVNYDYWLYGFNNSESFTDVRTQDCWVLDVEVAADGTKTFN
jgi:hypothetical protein